MKPNSKLDRTFDTAAPGFSKVSPQEESKWTMTEYIGCTTVSPAELRCKKNRQFGGFLSLPQRVFGSLSWSFIIENPRRNVYVRHSGGSPAESPGSMFFCPPSYACVDIWHIFWWHYLCNFLEKRNSKAQVKMFTRHPTCLFKIWKDMYKYNLNLGQSLSFWRDLPCWYHISLLAKPKACQFTFVSVKSLTKA